jgi:hypothetical protein
MIIEEIKEGLRDLVREKILNGWYVHWNGDGTRNWIISPVGQLTQSYNTDGIIDYVEMT